MLSKALQTLSDPKQDPADYGCRVLFTINTQTAIRKGGREDG